ncbi:MAG: methyltransferase domain-containing protein [Pseudomonadales bacterium]|nr:methyltransferase domain-containing protein [Pseudomonadales bacterium]
MVHWSSLSDARLIRNGFCVLESVRSSGVIVSPTEKSEYIPALRVNWLTPYYDSIVAATTRERTFKHALIRQTSVGAGERVLDLACGTGTLAVWLKQAVPTALVTGVDGDQAILSIARNKARSANVTVQFDHALSDNLPYPDAYFDRIVSSLFFHHLNWEAKERTAFELFRILKPGAELHVADWGYPKNPLMRCLFYSIQLLDGFENTGDNVAGRLPELFRSAHFSEVKQTQTFSTIFGTMALYKAVK